MYGSGGVFMFISFSCSKIHISRCEFLFDMTIDSARCGSTCPLLSHICSAAEMTHNISDIIEFSTLWFSSSSWVKVKVTGPSKLRKRPISKSIFSAICWDISIIADNYDSMGQHLNLLWPDFPLASVFVLWDFQIDPECNFFTKFRRLQSSNGESWKGLDGIFW